MGVMKTESKSELCTTPEVKPKWASRPLALELELILSRWLWERGEKGTQHRMAVTKLGFLSALTRRLADKTTFSPFATLAKKPSMKLKRVSDLECL